LLAQTALHVLAVLIAPAVSIARAISIARAALFVPTWPIEQKAHFAKRSKALYRTQKVLR